MRPPRCMGVAARMGRRVERGAAVAWSRRSARSPHGCRPSPSHRIVGAVREAPGREPRECAAPGSGCHCTERSTVTDVLIDRPELEGLGVYEFGWSDSDKAGASARRGISADVVTDISAPQGRAGVDAEEPAQGPRHVRAQADAHVGRRPLGHRLRQHQVLREVHRAPGADVGGPPRGHPRHLRAARASRRRSASASSAASRPSTSPRSSTTRSRRSWRRRASSSWTPTRP